jgi:hypothetical protein
VFEPSRSTRHRAHRAGTRIAWAGIGLLF